MADKVLHPYELARVHVQSLGIESHEQWVVLAGTCANTTRDSQSDEDGMLPFAEARSVVRSMGVNGQKEWEKL